MPRYIDAEKLIRDLIDNRNFYPAIVKNAIENAPTEDVVEVVRCKDCTLWLRGVCHHQSKKYTFTDANHYCSYGERKE